MSQQKAPQFAGLFVLSCIVGMGSIYTHNEGLAGELCPLVGIGKNNQWERHFTAHVFRSYNAIRFIFLYHSFQALSLPCCFGFSTKRKK